MKKVPGDGTPTKEMMLDESDHLPSPTTNGTTKVMSKHDRLLSLMISNDISCRGRGIIQPRMMSIIMFFLLLRLQPTME